MEPRDFDREFVKRTSALLEQYAELVMGRVPKADEFEVTLLINCLLGLLVYPKELSQRRNWTTWLTDVYVANVAADWGLDLKFIRKPGYRPGRRGSPPSRLAGIEGLTMRNLLRQMRNSVAHSSVSVVSAGSGQIDSVRFIGEGEDGLDIELPVTSLEAFTSKLAREYLAELDRVQQGNSGNLGLATKPTA